MNNSPEHDIKWSPKEWKIMSSVEVFIHKPNIMNKAEGYLYAFRDAMVEELDGKEKAFPPGTDLTKGQLVRGENLKGFPFISLDIPQMFTKTEMFTFRTVFWWGNYLIFSLILKGENLKNYKTALLKESHGPSWSKIYLGTSPTPWEWELTEKNYELVSKIPDEKIESCVNSNQHIKLCRFYAVGEDSFPSLDWVSAGLENWRTFSTITAP